MNIWRNIYKILFIFLFAPWKKSSTKMEKQIVTEKDYNFLWRVVSLQHALVCSAADPVVLRKVDEGADFEMTLYGGMYYDCCEKEARALETMKKRVESALEDILDHFRFHKKCIDYFSGMDNAIVLNDRVVFAENCEDACEGSLKYVDLVKKHKDKLGDNSFLEFPSCPPGHYFHVFNGLLVRSCYFNRQLTSSEAQSSIEKIEEDILDFKKRQVTLPYIHPPLHEQEEVGLFLPDLERNLMWNKQLLERLGVGFD